MNIVLVCGILSNQEMMICHFITINTDVCSCLYLKKTVCSCSL